MFRMALGNLWRWKIHPLYNDMNFSIFSQFFLQFSIKVNKQKYEWVTYFDQQTNQNNCVQPLHRHDFDKLYKIDFFQIVGVLWNFVSSKFISQWRKSRFYTKAIDIIGRHDRKSDAYMFNSILHTWTNCCLHTVHDVLTLNVHMIFLFLSISSHQFYCFKDKQLFIICF